MTLQRRVLLIFSASFVCLLVALYVVSLVILQRDIAATERADATQSLQASRGILKQRVEQLNQRFADWAAWDDTYEFVENRNGRFIGSNLQAESLNLLHINAILFLNRQGQIVFGTGFDETKKRREPVPQSLVQFVQAAPHLRRFSQLTDSHSGLLMLNGRLMILAFRPIITSKLSGPIRGTLVVGRYLTTADLHNLTQWSGIAFTVRPVTDNTLPPFVQQQLNVQPAQQGDINTNRPLAQSRIIVTQPVSRERLSAYTVLTDISQRATLLLQVDLPRTAYLNGLQSLRYLVAALFTSALVFGLVTLGSIRRLVLAPLITISQEVSEVRDKGDVTARVAVVGDGELSSLAHDINGMLATLEDAQHQVRENEERYRSATQHSAVGVALVSFDGHFLQTNRSLCRLLGYEEEELHLLTFQDITHPDDLDGNLQKAQQLIEGEIKTYQMEKRFYHKEGHEVWGLLSVSLVHDKAGKPLYFVSQVQDISSRKSAELLLQVAHEELTLRVEELTQRTREMALVGEMGEVLQICRSREEAAQAIAQSMQRLFPAGSGALSIMNASQDRVERMLQWGQGCIKEVVQSEYFAPDECWALRRSRLHCVESPSSDLTCAHTGTHLSHGYLCLPLMAERQTLGVLHLCHNHEKTWNETHLQLARTVAEHVSLSLFNLELQATLRQQSVRDPLTGLYNRRHMEEALARELSRAERNNSTIGIILCDVDHFKRFNDTFGHEAGDLVLREIGGLMKQNSRKMDVACRYGGEELLLILPDCSLEHAIERAEDLRVEVKSLALHHQGRSLGQVTLSVGVALYPEQGTTGNELIRAADALLYQAKREGRDRVLWASSVSQSIN
jgi:diguanylate cyclase (GGDEF)-like protein/PAS domain S-box-containing protein